MKAIMKIMAAAMALALLTACGTASTPESVESASQPEAPQSQPESTESAPEPSQSGSMAVETVNVLALKGPTGVGLAEMMTDKTDGYAYTLAASPEEAVAAVVNGSADIAALPTNLAATLYAKTGKEIQMLAVTTYGTLYILENGDTIQSIEDLGGKTIYATGQGANPEYILNYLLEQNGIVPGTDVTIEYKAEHAELATLAAEGSVSIAMLPEPNATAAKMQNAGLRVALDLTEEWGKVSDGQLTMGCFVVNKAFAAENPEAVARFLADAEESITFAQDAGNHKTAAVYCEALGIIPKAAVAEKALPNCSLVFVTGEEMKAAAEGYLEVLFGANPKSVGGALPDDDFYFLPSA